MSNGIREAEGRRSDPGESDPGEFGRSVRRFALDARDVLSRPDSPLDELIGLHRRVFELLDEVPGARSTGILCWLVAVKQRIGDRLQAWSAEDLESSVA
jgi:hypothetical protein